MTSRDHTYLIIGAGPAGLQLAYFLERAGLDYTILEAADACGSFFQEYPKHRKLLSINKVHTGRDDAEFNLRHDWNSLLNDRGILFKDHTTEYFPRADDLVEYLQRFARELKLRVEHGVRVTSIGKRSDGFELSTTTGTWSCRRLIVATGIAKPFTPPDVPGLELAIGYEDLSLDPEAFRNKAVLIVGKGNSALETAEHLIPTAAVIHVLSPAPVRHAWQTRYVGDVRAVNNNIFDTYHLKSQNAVIDGVIEEIRADEDGRRVVKFGSIHCPGETEQITYDHVIRCTGFRFDSSIFDVSCRPDMRKCGRLPLMTPSFESTNVEGLFFAGVLMQMLDYRKSQSAFIHGFRYNIRALAALLAHRDSGQPLPETVLEASSAAMAQHILDRMSVVSSLWQQVGFLCDVLIDEGAAPRLIHDLPYVYATSQDPLVRPAPEWRGGSFYAILFRFGAVEDVFNHPRSADLMNGAASVGIHPVVERWEGGQLVETFHVLEDFAADWTGQVYKDSLTCYFDAARRGEPLPLAQRAEVKRDIVRGIDMRLDG